MRTSLRLWYDGLGWIVAEGHGMKKGIERAVHFNVAEQEGVGPLAFGEGCAGLGEDRFGLATGGNGAGEFGGLDRTASGCVGKFACVPLWLLMFLLACVDVICCARPLDGVLAAACIANLPYL